MGATFDISNLGGVFSQVMEHQNRDILDIWTQGIDPLLASFEAHSSKDGLGRAFITRVEYDTGTAANPQFPLAQAQAQSTDLGNQAARARWVSNASKLEAICVWDRDSMLAAVGDGPGETIDIVARERKAKIALVRHRLSLFAAEAGWGRISTVSTINTGELFFTVPSSEISRFRIGDKIVFSASENAAVLRGADGTGANVGWGNPWIVSGTVPATSTVVLQARSSDNPYATDAVRANDTVFLHGYRQNSATPTRQCPIGMGGWVPMAEPAAGETSFEGLDRRNVYQLNGLRLDASVGSLSTIDTWIEAAMLAQQYDTEIDTFMASLQDIKIAIRDKERVKVIPMNVGQYDVGFEGIQILGGKGSIKVVGSRYIPQGKCWGGPFNSSEFGPILKHNGELVNTDNADGNEYLRLAGSAAFEQRLFFRGCMVVPGPGKFIAISNMPSS
jgi:hypothetical protein